MAESMTDGIFLARPETAAEGIPLAVKDLFDTAGLDDHVRIGPLHRSPAHTAEAVTLLEAAGYANAGKANLHEFAYGVTSENPHFGAAEPAPHGRIAGGSSGGSAALAAGLADAALGTDSGGSIRIPAACCGSSASSRRLTASSPSRCFRSRRAGTTLGRWHARSASARR